MADIVKFIRDNFEDSDEIISWHDDGSYRGGETVSHLVGLMEAALLATDEIERLRTELERIADLSEKWQDSLVSQINVIARAALEEK